MLTGLFGLSTLKAAWPRLVIRAGYASFPREKLGMLRTGTQKFIFQQALIAQTDVLAFGASVLIKSRAVSSRASSLGPFMTLASGRQIL